MSNLILEKINKKFVTPSGDIEILKEVNLTVNPGERVAIVGESGSGKSTLLQITGLLDKATKGEIIINGEKTSQLKDRQKSALRNKYIGFVYQSHHLLREFTALENVVMPSMIAGKGDKQRAKDLLTKVGLKDRMEHYPYALSGGEQQRVAIARALMNSPKILLADEPTGNLDPATAEEVSALLNKIVKEENMAMLVVTHSQHFAEQCDKVLKMQDGVLA